MDNCRVNYLFDRYALKKVDKPANVVSMWVRSDYKVKFVYALGFR